MSKEKINIYEIAKEARVSPATVSRVITNNAKVSNEKKARVQALIDKYNFKPNALARGLSVAETRTIGIIASDVRNPFYASLFVECEKAANERGYTVLLCNSLGKNELEDDHLEKLIQQRVDAVIQIGGRVDEMISDKKYVKRVNEIAHSYPVIINGKLDGGECYRVNINEGLGMEKLMEYLIGLGHKSIALVGGRKDVQSTYEKRKVYKQLLKKYGLPYKKEYIVEAVHYDIESGYQCMNQMFEWDRLPTAVIAINDFTAIGIMRSIMEHGLSIPKDISVASFDNTYYAEASIPQLTSVGYDYEMFGHKLIDVAIKAVQKEEPEKLQFINSILVVRDSCTKPSEYD